MWIEKEKNVFAAFVITIPWTVSNHDRPQKDLLYLVNIYKCDIHVVVVVMDQDSYLVLHANAQVEVVLDGNATQYA